MLSSEREGLKQGGNFRGSFYLTEIKQVHSIVDNLVYNLFIFRMIGTETQWLCGTINKINKIIRVITLIKNHPKKVSLPLLRKV